MEISHNICVVIPAHNEAPTVASVVRSAKQYVATIIVVDDASTDATKEQALSAGAHVLHLNTAHGYDGAINVGFSEAVTRGADVIVTMDADGEHDASDIPRIVEPILAGHADVVAGMRPQARHVPERLFGWYTRARFNIPDPLCGLKAYSRRAYETVGTFDSKRMIGTELMIRILRRGGRIATMPITVHPRPANDSSRFYAARFRGDMRILKALFFALWI